MHEAAVRVVALLEDLWVTRLEFTLIFVENANQVSRLTSSTTTMESEFLVAGL